MATAGTTPCARSKVLILCTGNSARSQMAEGLLRHNAGTSFEAWSAGTQPSQVHMEAVAVMKELGIDISSHRSKSVKAFGGSRFGFVITVCDKARESCPIFPAITKRIHWSIEDPAAVEGSAEDRLAFFRQARDELREHLRRFALRQAWQKAFPDETRALHAPKDFSISSAPIPALQFASQQRDQMTAKSLGTLPSFYPKFFI